MNKLLNNLLGMYKQAKLNKKAEEVVYDSDLIAQVLSMTKNQKEDEFSIVTLSPEKDKVLGVKYIKKDEVYDYKPNQNEYALVMTRDTGFADTDYQLQPMIMVVRSWNEGRKFYATKKNRLNKKAEEKESAKKDYTEQYAKVKEIMKEYGYGLSDGGYIYLISKEEPKDEGFQVKFKGDRLRVELDGKLKYSGYGPEAIEDFLKGMFYAKKLSSKKTRKSLHKKAISGFSADVMEINERKLDEIRNTAKDMGDEIWARINENIVKIIAYGYENGKLKIVYREPYYGKEEIEEMYENADEVSLADFETLELQREELEIITSKAKAMRKRADLKSNIEEFDKAWEKHEENFFKDYEQTLLTEYKGNLTKATQDLINSFERELPKETLYKLLKEYIDRPSFEKIEEKDLQEAQQLVENFNKTNNEYEKNKKTIEQKIEQRLRNFYEMGYRDYKYDKDSIKEEDTYWNNLTEEEKQAYYEGVEAAKSETSQHKYNAFYWKTQSSKTNRLQKKAKIVLEQIGNEYYLDGKKGDYSDFNYDGKYKQTNYKVFVDDKGKTHKVWEFEGTLDKQTTKKQATIKHENGVYNVYSESGKCLGKGYKTKEEAEKRLKQVEYFKHKKASVIKKAKNLSEIDGDAEFMSDLEIGNGMPYNSDDYDYFEVYKIHAKNPKDTYNNKYVVVSDDGSILAVREKEEDIIEITYDDMLQELRWRRLSNRKTQPNKRTSLKKVEYFKNKKAVTGTDYWGPKEIPDEEEEGTFIIRYYGGPGHIDYLRKSRNGKYHWVEQTHFDYINDKPFETTDYELAKKLVEQYGGEIEKKESKQVNNKRTSLKQVVISKMAKIKK